MIHVAFLILGFPISGLESKDLELLARGDRPAVKTSRRDMAVALARVCTLQLNIYTHMNLCYKNSQGT